MALDRVATGAGYVANPKQLSYVHTHKTIKAHNKMVFFLEPAHSAVAPRSGRTVTPLASSVTKAIASLDPGRLAVYHLDARSKPLLETAP